jgi:hypothetical protein
MDVVLLVGDRLDRTDELLNTVGDSVNACHTRMIQWKADCFITVLMCLVASVKSKLFMYLGFEVLTVVVM